MAHYFFRFILILALPALTAGADDTKQTSENSQKPAPTQSYQRGSYEQGRLYKDATGKFFAADTKGQLFEIDPNHGKRMKAKDGSTQLFMLAIKKDQRGDDVYLAVTQDHPTLWGQIQGYIHAQAPNIPQNPLAFDVNAATKPLKQLWDLIPYNPNGEFSRIMNRAADGDVTTPVNETLTH